MELKIDIPDGLEVNIEKNSVNIKGKQGELKRTFNSLVELKKEDNQILLSTEKERRKHKALMGAIISHINNMFHGVSDKIVYRSKIVYSHFPMNVKVQGDVIIIDNFLGEKHPRKARILEGVDVKIAGQEVTVSGINKEKVSQTAANLEQATKIKNRDPRVFQDGIYIIEKDGKLMS
ncbi:MAG: 50S ribosomal protein L6 [Candidatus Altiarchaeales archaeon HGW-Altiarchaeales-3]|nr:MAG: 50S ribosomal protein L6 [Candidatus Altiarchaeales archaeon HGW-Altiarchaeales-3]